MTVSDVTPCAEEDLLLPGLEHLAVGVDAQLVARLLAVLVDRGGSQRSVTSLASSGRGFAARSGAAGAWFTRREQPLDGAVRRRR